MLENHKSIYFANLSFLSMPYHEFITRTWWLVHLYMHLWEFQREWKKLYCYIPNLLFFLAYSLSFSSLFFFLVQCTSFALFQSKICKRADILEPSIKELHLLLTDLHITWIAFSAHNMAARQWICTNACQHVLSIGKACYYIPCQY